MFECCVDLQTQKHNTKNDILQALVAPHTHTSLLLNQLSSLSLLSSVRPRKPWNQSNKGISLHFQNRSLQAQPKLPKETDSPAPKRVTNRSTQTERNQSDIRANPSVQLTAIKNNNLDSEYVGSSEHSVKGEASSAVMSPLAKPRTSKIKVVSTIEESASSANKIKYVASGQTPRQVNLVYYNQQRQEYANTKRQQCLNKQGQSWKLDSMACGNKPQVMQRFQAYRARITQPKKHLYLQNNQQQRQFQLNRYQQCIRQTQGGRPSQLKRHQQNSKQQVRSHLQGQNNYKAAKPAQSYDLARTSHKAMHATPRSNQNKHITLPTPPSQNNHNHINNNINNMYSHTINISSININNTNHAQYTSRLIDRKGLVVGDMTPTRKITSEHQTIPSVMPLHLQLQQNHIKLHQSHVQVHSQHPILHQSPRQVHTQNSRINTHQSRINTQQSRINTQNYHINIRNSHIDTHKTNASNQKSINKQVHSAQGTPLAHNQGKIAQRFRMLYVNVQSEFKRSQARCSQGRQSQGRVSQAKLPQQYRLSEDKLPVPDRNSQVKIKSNIQKKLQFIDRQTIKSRYNNSEEHSEEHSLRVEESFVEQADILTFFTPIGPRLQYNNYSISLVCQNTIGLGVTLKQVPSHLMTNISEELFVYKQLNEQRKELPRLLQLYQTQIEFGLYIFIKQPFTQTLRNYLIRLFNRQKAERQGSLQQVQKLISVQQIQRQLYRCLQQAEQCGLKLKTMPVLQDFVMVFEQVKIENGLLLGWQAQAWVQKEQAIVHLRQAIQHLRESIVQFKQPLL